MRNCQKAIVAAVVLLARSAGWAEGLKVTFTDATPETRFELKEIGRLLPGAPLPENWADCTHITFEWRSSTAQPFSVELFSKDGAGEAEVVASRALQPYENAWTWVMLPLEYFRKAIVLPEANALGHNVQCFVDTKHGSPTPVKLVAAVGFRMEHPLGKEAAVLEIRDLSVGQGATVAKPAYARDRQLRADIMERFPETIPTDQPYRTVTEKVVDKFGQWKPAEWAGKIKSSEELQAAWEEEEKNLKAADFGYDTFGGLRGTQAKGAASGFFRVEQVDGKWWFVDPEGRLFYAAGVTGLPNRGEAFTTKWTEFDVLLPRVVGPPPGANGGSFGGNVAFYEFNYITRHDPTHVGMAKMMQGHYALARRRIEAWGLNVCDVLLPGTNAQKKPYVAVVDNWSFQGLNYPYPRPAEVTGPPMTYIMGMPDVYSADFEKLVEAKVAQVCTEPKRADPYLLGYQIDFGPPWITREGMFCDQVLAGRPSELKQRLQNHLKEGDTPARRREFAYAAFERYLSVMVGVIRKQDTNHLILGMGFQQVDLPGEFFRFARHFDVFSMDMYDETPERATVERLHKLSGKPVLISAFGFGAVGRGMGGGPAAVADQTQRARAYRYYAEQAAALPAVVGALWYGWVDQPALGQMGNTYMARFVNGENYNLGLVDVTDRPYEELVAAMVTTHKRLGDVHSGKVSPTRERAERVVLSSKELTGAAR